MKSAPTLSASRKWFLLVVAGTGLAAIGNAQDSAVVAHDAWVRLPPPSKMDAALYVVLENHSAEPRAAVSASSEAATACELHEMKMEKMTMVMNRIPRLAIPAKGKATLSPNSYHLMLFGLKKKLAVGDMIEVTFQLDNGMTVPVTAVVRK